MFDRLVNEHKADHRAPADDKEPVLALLFGQLSGATSLREIEAGLLSHEARLYHVGGRGVARVTLANANARRPPALLPTCFHFLAENASRQDCEIVRAQLFCSL